MAEEGKQDAAAADEMDLYDLINDLWVVIGQQPEDGDVDLDPDDENILQCELFKFEEEITPPDDEVLPVAAPVVPANDNILVSKPPEDEGNNDARAEMPPSIVMETSEKPEEQSSQGPSDA